MPTDSHFLDMILNCHVITSPSNLLTGGMGLDDFGHRPGANLPWLGNAQIGLVQKRQRCSQFLFKR
jgi:hypothetical protein